MIATSTIESLRSKNPIAQKNIFEHYGSFLYRVAYRYVRDRMTAEDLVVDSFLKIFEGAANFRFDNLRSFEAWMKRIVINESLMLLRKQANFNLMPESEAIEVPVDDNILDSISSDEIHQLIAENEKIMEEIVDSSDQNELKRFSRHDLAQLLEIVE